MDEQIFTQKMEILVALEEQIREKSIKGKTKKVNKLCRRLWDRAYEGYIEIQNQIEALQEKEGAKYLILQDQQEAYTNRLKNYNPLGLLRDYFYTKAGGKSAIMRRAGYTQPPKSPSKQLEELAQKAERVSGLKKPEEAGKICRQIVILARKRLEFEMAVDNYAFEENMPDTMKQSRAIRASLRNWIRDYSENGDDYKRLVGM